MTQAFTNTQKQHILERDEHRCVMCGKGSTDGTELFVEFIIPVHQGGQPTITNGQTLCTEHHLQRQEMDGIVSGKDMIMEQYEEAKRLNDATMMAFYEDILAVYAKHDINGHIEWRE